MVSKGPPNQDICIVQYQSNLYLEKLDFTAKSHLKQGMYRTFDDILFGVQMTVGTLKYLIFKTFQINVLIDIISTHLHESTYLRNMTICILVLIILKLYQIILQNNIVKSQT